MNVTVKDPTREPYDFEEYPMLVEHNENIVFATASSDAEHFYGISISAKPIHLHEGVSQFRKRYYTKFLGEITLKNNIL